MLIDGPILSRTCVSRNTIKHFGVAQRPGTLTGRPGAFLLMLVKWQRPARADRTSSGAGEGKEGAEQGRMDRGEGGWVDQAQECGNALNPEAFPSSDHIAGAHSS